MTFKEDYKEAYKAGIVLWDWGEYSRHMKKETMLFDRTIIDLGRRAKEKWRKIVEEKASDCGTSDCAYCTQFHKPERLECKGCPVEFFTKKARCLASPYYDYVRNPKAYGISMKDFIDEIFIRSLLLIDWRKYYEMSCV